MLIVNENQLRLAGIAGLEEQCCHCSRPLAAYPLIMGDDTRQTVYHVTCALELATDLLVDLATFFHPPAPYPPLFVLTASQVFVPHADVSREKEGMTHAVVNGRTAD